MEKKYHAILAICLIAVFAVGYYAGSYISVSNANKRITLLEASIPICLLNPNATAITEWQNGLAVNSPSPCMYGHIMAVRASAGQWQGYDLSSLTGR